MARVFQSVFYLLGYNKEDICEKGTNKLHWKKAKKLLNDELFKNIKNFTPIGHKAKNYKRYQLINFIERNIKGNKNNLKSRYQ